MQDDAEINPYSPIKSHPPGNKKQPVRMKSAILFLLPSLLFILFGMLGVYIHESLMFVSLYACPVLAIVCASITTRDLAAKCTSTTAKVGIGLLVFVAHAAILFFGGFYGCVLLAISTKGL